MSPDDVPDVLRGLTMNDRDLRAQLQPTGRMEARIYGTCRKCREVTMPGTPLVQCLRYGWMHPRCREEALAELEARTQ